VSAEVKGTKKTETQTLVESALAAAIDEKVHDLEHQLEVPLGDPTDEKLNDYTAKWGDVVIASASHAGLTVTLPLATHEDAGKHIVVKNLHSTTAITVTPGGADLIDGDNASVTIAAGKGYLYYSQASGKWLEFWR
jgi:hypothetical protein